MAQSQAVRRMDSIVKAFLRFVNCADDNSVFPEKKQTRRQICRRVCCCSSFVIQLGFPGFRLG